MEAFRARVRVPRIRLTAISVVVESQSEPNGAVSAMPPLRSCDCMAKEL